MLYSTKVVINMETMEIVCRDRHTATDCEWCKGASSREQNIANQQMANQNALMQQQLALQQGQIGMVDPTIQKILAAGGMLPQQEAAMTSLAMNQLPQDFNSTIGSINNALAARGVSGGGMAGSGDIARNFGQLGALEDYMKSNELQNIQLQKGAGLYNAMNEALGIGGMYGQNMDAFNRGATSALGSATSAAQASDQASSSMFGSLFGALTSPFNITGHI